MRRNLSSDKKQLEKYSLIFGEKLPKTVAEFQEMKYTDVNQWKQFQDEKQTKFNSLDYQKSFDHLFGDVETRLWYIAKNDNIISLIDTEKSLKNQALQAHSLRNTYKRQARDMMSNRKKALELDKERPLLGFKYYVNKYSKLNSNQDEVYSVIIGSSRRTNSGVNKTLGVGVD